MKSVLMLCSVFVLYSSSSVALSGNELSQDIKPEYPTKSIYHANSQIQVKRYVISHPEESQIYAVAKKVSRDVGSNKNKKVRIIWANKSVEKLAKNLKDMLVNLNINTKQIGLERSKAKKEIYPIYIEIQFVAPKRINCQVDTAEDMMTFDPYVPCASQNNLQIQLKN